MKKWMMAVLVGCLTLPPMLAQAATSKKGQSQSNTGISDEFTFKGMIDLKAFNMSNIAYTETSDWYFYPVYRTIVSKGFAKQHFTLLADLEKPGYADVTYPFIKVNELYAKFQESTFYVKLGRQQFGDTDDLLLGLQNDAISAGFDLGSVDLMAFFARTRLLAPWVTGGFIESLIGFVPTFDMGHNMNLDAKLLIGNQPITITTGTPHDSINSLVQAGGRFNMLLPAGDEATLDLAAQLGLQFAMARTATDNSIDATSLGVKLDATYGMKADQFNLDIGGHIIYTGGNPEPGTNTKAGFASLNALPGAGPGLFSKIEDGAGPYTYLDDHLAGLIIRDLAGIMAAGLTAKMEIGAIVPGLGFWFYSDTNKDGKGLGMEVDFSAAYRLSQTVSFYAQLGLFTPNRDGLEGRGLWQPNPPAPLPATPDPKAVTKLLIGSSINF